MQGHFYPLGRLLHIGTISVLGQAVTLSFLSSVVLDGCSALWTSFFPPGAGCFVFMVGYSISVLSSYGVLVTSAKLKPPSSLSQGSWTLCIPTSLRKRKSPSHTLCLVIKALLQPRVALGWFRHHKAPPLTSFTSRSASF